MKIRIGSLIFAVSSLVIVSGLAHGQGKCQTSEVAQWYSECVSPTHPPIYKNAADDKCTPIYHSCRSDKSKGTEIIKDVTVDYYGFMPVFRGSDFEGWVMEGASGEEFCKPILSYEREKYGPNGFNAALKNATYNRDGYMEFWEDQSVTFKTRPSFNKFSLFFMKGELDDDNYYDVSPIWDFAKYEVVTPIQKQPGGAYYLAQCKVTFSVTIPAKEATSGCNIKGYQTCPAPAHGIESYEKLRSKACPVDERTTWLQSPYAKRSSEARTECVTDESAPEATLPQIEAKIAALGKSSLKIVPTSQDDSNFEVIEAKVAVKLEAMRLDRLAAALGQPSSLLPRTNLQQTLEKMIAPVGSVDHFVDMNWQGKRYPIVAGLFDLYPEIADKYRAKLSDQILSLDQAQFVTVYSEGTTLPAASIPTLKKKIEALSDSHLVFRGVEAVVRSTLKDDQVNQQTILKIQALRMRVLAARGNLDSLFNETKAAVKLSPAELAELSNDYESYKSSFEDQKAGLSAFLSDQAKALQESRKHTLKSLWAYVEQVRGSAGRDPMFPILDAYRSLSQVKADEFQRNVSLLMANLKETQSAKEAQISFASLMEGAKGYRDSLNSVTSLLSGANPSDAQLHQKLADRLVSALSNQTLADEHLMDLVDVATSSIHGGFGADSNLRIALEAQVKAAYSRFQAVLNALEVN